MGAENYGGKAKWRKWRKRTRQCTHGGIITVGLTLLRHRRNKETAKMYQQEEGTGIRACWSKGQKRGDCLVFSEKQEGNAKSIWT